MQLKKTKLLIILLSIQCSTTQAEDLLTLYRQATQSDPTTKLAQLQVELGEAQLTQARGTLMPQINANVNISGSNQNITSAIPNAPAVNNASLYGGERYTVALTQSVIDLPKFYNWQRYQNIVEQYESGNEEAQQTLMYNIIERYFNVLEVSDTLSLVEQEMESTHKQLQQMQRQFKKQMVKITDVYELEAKLDLLSANQIAVQTKLDIAQQNLMELTGKSTQQLAALRQDILFPQLTGSIDEWVAQAETLNPGVIAQNKAIDAADQNLWQQQAKHLPTVDMQLNYFNTNTGQPGFQNQTSLVETEMAAVNINVPIFSSGVSSGGVDEASKNLEINKEKRTLLLRTLIKDTRDSFLSTNASIKRISAAEKALESSAKAREAMQKGFRLGMQSISDVLVSEDREFKAKQDILQAKYEYIKNRARFEKSTGLINDKFIQTVNQWLQTGKS